MAAKASVEGGSGGGAGAVVQAVPVVGGAQAGQHGRRSRPGLDGGGASGTSGRLTSASRFAPHRASSGSVMSEEELRQVALKGKELINLNIAGKSSSKLRASSREQAEDSGGEGRGGSKARADSAHSTGSALRATYTFARVDYPFDAVAMGYAARGDPEEGFLQLEQDDIVEIDLRLDADWWEGRLWDPLRGRSAGEPGRFPSSYVVPIADPYDPWDEGDPEGEARAAQEAKEKAERERHKRWLVRNRLFLSLLELVTNEYKYVLSMWVCTEVFVGQIEKRFGLDFVGALFPSWQTITRTHEGILKRLAEASRATWKKLQRLGAGSAGSQKK